MSTATDSLARRLWSRVDKTAGPDDCWPWTAYLYKNGYATIQVDGRKRMAHRVAFELTTGTPVPDDMTIDHLCRRRDCMNPSHLEVVTRGENTRRGAGWIESVRVRRAQAEVACPSGHPRSHARKDANGNWRCRPCCAARARAARARQRAAA